MRDTVEKYKEQTIDELIKSVCSLLKPYDPKMQQRIDDAYRKGDYYTVKKLLIESMRSVKRHLSQETMQMIRHAVFSADEPKHMQKQRKGDQNMKPLIILAIALLVAILVIVAVISLKKKTKGNETVSALIPKRKQPKQLITYTEADRDMLELIHLLAEITYRENEFLNS